MIISPPKNTDASSKQNFLVEGNSTVLNTLLKLIRFYPMLMCIVWELEAVIPNAFSHSSARFADLGLASRD